MPADSYTFPGPLMPVLDEPLGGLRVKVVGRSPSEKNAVVVIEIPASGVCHIKAYINGEFDSAGLAGWGEPHFQRLLSSALAEAAGSVGLTVSPAPPPSPAQ